MELADHIRKISFIFFILLGGIHFIAGFLFVNGYAVNTAAVINRALFIPFVISTLTYAFSNSVYHRIQNGNRAQTLGYIYVAIGILILGGLIALEILVPDSSSILIAPK